MNAEAFSHETWRICFYLAKLHFCSPFFGFDAICILVSIKTLWLVLKSLNWARHFHRRFHWLLSLPWYCFRCKLLWRKGSHCTAVLTLVCFLVSPRCGNNYCARHRYAEVHDCPYDYKAEGRKLIQEANPVVTASKLPKIWLWVWKRDPFLNLVASFGANGSSSFRL